MGKTIPLKVRLLLFPILLRRSVVEKTVRKSTQRTMKYKSKILNGKRKL